MVLGFLTSVLTLRNWCYSFITTKRQSKQNAPTEHRALGTGAEGTIAPPYFGRNRSKTFSFKRPWMT